MAPHELADWSVVVNSQLPVWLTLGRFAVAVAVAVAVLFVLADDGT